MTRCPSCGRERMTAAKMQAALQRVWDAGKLLQDGSYFEDCAAARERMLAELQCQQFALISMSAYCECDGSESVAA